MPSLSIEHAPPLSATSPEDRARDIAMLLREHCALLRHCGAVQARCSDLIAAQAAEIERLRLRAMRLQAAVVLRDTALAWAREDLAAVQTAHLPVHEAKDLARLEASLVAADLVICQTGCLSHGAYWRVKDHCRRTGKTCVLVAQPDAVRIVRIDNAQASTQDALPCPTGHAQR